MLSAFILPVAEFDAAAQPFRNSISEYPLRISALGPRMDNAEAFLQSLCAAKDSIEVFSKICGADVSIDQLEMPLPADFEAESLKRMRSVLVHSKLNAFWEAPAKLAATAIQLIAESNAAHPARKFGFKLRTGGVTAEAFPSSRCDCGRAGSGHASRECRSSSRRDCIIRCACFTRACKRRCMAFSMCWARACSRPNTAGARNKPRRCSRTNRQPLSHLRDEFFAGATGKFRRNAFRAAQFGDLTWQLQLR